MPFAGFIWGTIICVPFGLIVILFVKTGIIAMETIIFVGLVLSGLLLFLILTSPQNTKQDEQDQQLFSPATKARPFYNMKMEFKLADNGGTRTGIDRRKLHYTAYIPERRSGILNSAYASLPKAGAQCGSPARWDLSGGHRVTGVPTGITPLVSVKLGGNLSL